MHFKYLEAYTDGSCTDNGNDGAGGWAYIIINEDGSETINYGGEEHTTSNRMELTAILECLNSIKDKANILIYSDSKYCVNIVNVWRYGWERRNWIKSDGQEIKNLEIIKSINDLCKFHEVKMEWVKGHNGNYYNEMADELANNATTMYLPCYYI